MPEMVMQYSAGSRAVSEAFEIHQTEQGAGATGTGLKVLRNKYYSYYGGNYDN